MNEKGLMKGRKWGKEGRVKGVRDGEGRGRKGKSRKRQ